MDELYDTVIVRPLSWTSRVVLANLVDRKIIDGLVNAVGYLSRTVGVFVQVLQSGNIQRYIAIFAVGLAVLIYGWLLPSGAPNTLSAAPTQVDTPEHTYDAAAAPDGGEAR